MADQVLSGQAGVSLGATRNLSTSLVQITNVSTSVTSGDFTCTIPTPAENATQVTVIYTYTPSDETSIPSEGVTQTLNLNNSPLKQLDSTIHLESVVINVVNSNGDLLLSYNATPIYNPNFEIVILESETYTSNYYYFVLIDLPSSCANPSLAAGSVNGDSPTTLTFNLGYSLPNVNTATPVDTITYLLWPTPLSSGSPIVEVVALQGKSGTTPVKGSATGIQVSTLPGLHNKNTAVTNRSFQCRSFVLKSSKTPPTYFVGALLDLPDGYSLSYNPSSPPAPIDGIWYVETTPQPTATAAPYLIYPVQSTYSGGQSPTATYTGIFVPNYQNKSGWLLNASEKVNQYVNNPLIQSGLTLK